MPRIFSLGGGLQRTERRSADRRGSFPPRLVQIDSQHFDLVSHDAVFRVLDLIADVKQTPDGRRVLALQALIIPRYADLSSAIRQDLRTMRSAALVTLFGIDASRTPTTLISIVLHFGYPDSQMECAECTRLLAFYEKLKRDYVTAVQGLGAGRHSSSAREYIQLKIAVDETRRDSERAETELSQHKREHAKGKDDWSPLRSRW
jgi:hypothetical protein